MTPRAIENTDLVVTRGWTERHGRIRTHVSLKGLSAVNYTFWLKPTDAADPATLVRVKDTLATRLRTHLERCQQYLAK